MSENPRPPLKRSDRSNGVFVQTPDGQQIVFENCSINYITCQDSVMLQLLDTAGKLTAVFPPGTFQHAYKLSNCISHEF